MGKGEELGLVYQNLGRRLNEVLQFLDFGTVVSPFFSPAFQLVLLLIM
jgi:hypothetical protein